MKGIAFITARELCIYLQNHWLETAVVSISGNANLFSSMRCMFHELLFAGVMHRFYF